MNQADALARRVAQAMLEREGTGPSWAIKFLDAREGYARISMRVRADMLNGHEAAHGGMVFALADTAFAYACNSRDETSVAHSASITFLAAAKEGDELIAEAQESARVGRTATYHVSVRAADGRAIADFTGTSRTTGGSYLAGASEPLNSSPKQRGAG